MFVEAGQFLFQVVFDLAATAFWLRFYMQLVRVPFGNPFAQFVVKVTDFAVKPLRRVIPGFFGLDWASLILFFLAELLLVLASHWLVSYPFLAATAQVWPGFMLFALAACLRLAIYVTIGLILIQAVLSWTNPFSPVAPVFYALARPVLAPFQRFIPLVGGVDLSPLAAFVVLQLLLILPVAALDRFARSLVW